MIRRPTALRGLPVSKPRASGDDPCARLDDDLDDG